MTASERYAVEVQIGDSWTPIGLFPSLRNARLMALGLAALLRMLKQPRPVRTRDRFTDRVYEVPPATGAERTPVARA